MKEKVVVAMSGGVDSSTAAALLKESGYDVIGISLKLPGLDGYFRNSSSEIGCCGIRGIEDARSVAYKIDIPFYVIDIEKEFERDVITPFCEEYLKGRTPNPCVVCNEKIKFGSLLAKAKTLGASFVATGHYAKVSYNRDATRYILSKGIDPRYDQSYFLYSLSQEQLRHTLFPMGEYLKSQTRQIAENIGLSVFNKSGSQDICFIPNNDYCDFLKKRFPSAFTPGPMIDTSGKIVGRHRGIAFYTIGQRKRLGIALGRPMYVVEINKEKNTIVIGEEKDVYKSALIAHSVKYLAIPELKSKMEVTSKIRYTHPGALSFITPIDNGNVRCEFMMPQKAITPGQSVVFYKDDIVLGGGIIERAES